jgi:O-antigen/teichoic acid export membrane protein
VSVRFIFGSSAAYLAVTVATSATSLLLVPLMTRVLTRADYGAMLLIANGASVISFLFGLSVAAALPTLFSNAATDERRRALCSTMILSVAVMQLLPYILIVLLSQQVSIFFLRTPDYASAIVLGAIWSFLNACTLCLVLIVRMLERHTLYLMVQLPALFLQVTLIVWLLLFVRTGLYGFYIATAAAAAIAVIAYCFALRHWISGPFEFRQFATAGRIGMQLLPWHLASLLTMSSAAFFLTLKGHLDEAGLFSVASGAASLLFAISNAVESVWSPFVLRRKDEPDLARMQVRIFSLFSSALLIAASAISLFAHELFLVMVGPALREGFRFVPALNLAFCILAFANCFAQGLQARQRTIHYAWIGMVASAVFLATCLVLVGPFGAFGIIAGMGAAFSTMLILLQVMSARFMPVPYPWARHGLMWLIAVIIVAYSDSLDVSASAIAIKLVALVIISGLPFVFGAVHWSDVRLARDTLRLALP